MVLAVCLRMRADKEPGIDLSYPYIINILFYKVEQEKD